MMEPAATVGAMMLVRPLFDSIKMNGRPNTSTTLTANSTR